MPADECDILSDEHAVEQAKEYLRKGNTVGFYERVASQLLLRKPDNPINFCIKIVEKIVDDANTEEPLAGDGANPQSEPDDKYMKKHNVSDFLDKWILALITSGPGKAMSDPADADNARLEFHQQYLKNLNGTTQ